MSSALCVQSLLAALVGTACMTVSSETEATVAGREPSKAPGRAVSRILQLSGAAPLEGKALAVAAIWAHWFYGIAWGVAFWILIDPDAASWPTWLAGVALFIIVMIAAQVVPPVFAGTRPSFMHGGRAFAIEAWHHAVYAAATAGSFAVVEWLKEAELG